MDGLAWPSCNSHDSHLYKLATGKRLYSSAERSSIITSASYLSPGIRVLWIDDDKRHALEAERACQRLGIRFSHVAAFLPALDVLRQGLEHDDPFHIVSIGKDSQGMDADILAAALKNDERLKDLLLLRLEDQPVENLQGSPFFWNAITLPCDCEQMMAMIASARSALKPLPPLAGRRALIVDDDPACRTAAISLLEARGCRTAQAENGLEACAMQTAAPFDLILMDIDMPGLDGKGAARCIRAGDATQPLILAVTASTVSNERQDCLAAGMNDFIAKPLKAATLDDSLANWFDVLPSATAMNNLATEKEADAPDELEEVKADFGPVFAELASLYRQDGPSRIAAMWQAFSRSDAAALAKVSHALGGSSASIGARGLAARCKALELLARTALPDDASERISDIEREYARIASRLEAMIALDIPGKSMT